MFSVIDCGTTNSRVYILDDNGTMVAQGSRKIGVRDTSMTGSKKTLKEGLESLFNEVLVTNSIKR